MRGNRDQADTWDVAQTAQPVAQQWSVECLDPFGRWRGMTVLARGEDVLLVSPPGESAVLSIEQTQKLGRALAAALTAVAEPYRSSP